MKSVGIFVDLSNQFHCTKKKFRRKLDYKKYFAKASKDYTVSRAVAYGSQIADEAKTFISCLKYIGFQTKYRQPLIIETEETTRFRIDWDVGIAMDVVRCIEKLNVVILGSSDPDLIPLVEYIQEKGCECIIFSTGINKKLKDVANKWIEITEDLLEDEKNVITNDAK